jgi:predicted secreted Zn-dependent protease
MRRALLAAAALGLACSSSAPPPGPAPVAGPAAAPAPVRPTITVREQYYDIDGASAGALRDQIRRLGPKDGGQSRDALTVWNLEWAYREAPSGDGCALRDVRVTLDVAITLPRWNASSGAVPGLVSAWRSYVEHVKLHEAGHRAIAERNARDLTAALATLRAPTCREAGDSASRMAEQIVADGRARNRAYDVETKHGQTQGVVLGP